MRSIIRLLAVIPLSAVVACEGAAGWSGTVSDSAGIEIVENPGTGLWQGNGPQPVIELDIGTAAGDAASEFGQVAALEVDAAGNIYVLDTQAQHVVVFDADGNHLRTMGGPGSGPGELGMGVAQLVMTTGDTLLVPDMIQSRITRFAPNGESVGTVPLPIQQGLSLRWERLPDGRILQQSRAMPNPENPQPPTGDPLLIRSPGGELLDTLMVLPAGGTFQMTQGAMQIRMFEPEPMWTTLSHGGVAFAMNEQYSIHMYSVDGDLDRILRMPFERQPVTQEDQDNLRQLMVDAMIEQAGAMGATPEQLGQARAMINQMVQFGDFYPAFMNLRGGPSGSLWVQHVRTAAEAIADGEPLTIQTLQNMGSGRWDVFDSQGRYLGVIDMPARFTPLLFKGDRLYGVQLDDLDVVHVLRVNVPIDWGALSS